jgi:PKD repeat protein
MKFFSIVLLFVLVMSTWATPGLGQNCPPNGPFPHPHITSSFTPDSSCQSQSHNTAGQGDKGGCLYACENQYSTFCTVSNVGSTYTWIVTGGTIASGQGTGCVTILWGPAGSGSITVTETNVAGCAGTDMSCIQVINSPVANFHVDTTVCRKVTLYFQDLSLNAVSWFWNFGDGNTSTNQNPTHAYLIGGTYTVTLVVSNHCGCKDSATKVIHVSNLTGPNIECPATVCAFTEGCYNTFDTCAGAVYHWSVTGGTFTVSPSGTNVCVNWGAGPVGTISLWISGCPNTCPDTTTVVIPIIGNTATIAGPPVVCPSTVTTYSVPTWPGTYYNWTLSGGGTIIGGPYSQAVSVSWGTTPGIYTLNVTWNNILLKCGGSATLQVNIRDHFFIVGPPGPFCVGDSSNFGAVANANWTVTGGTISGSPLNTTSIVVHWTTSGTQTVIASPVNTSLYCNLADSLHLVVDSVPKAASISGPQVICVGGTYQYTATPSGPGYSFLWSTTGGGSIVGSNTANPVSVIWSGPGTIAVQQVRTSAPFCMSDTIGLNVSVFSLTAITGPDSVCMDQTVTYTAGPSYPGITYTWAIVSGTNPSPYGSITNGQGTNQITVLWHGPGNMNATVQLTVCGNTYSLPIKIFPLPTPTITMSGHVCDPGGSMILTASPGYIQYVWSNATTGPSTVVYASGTYSVIVTGPGGCKDTAYITVPYTPGPVASISTPNPISWCIGGPPMRDTLYALQGQGYSYFWTPGSLTTPTIVVTSAGTYSVTVTDANGCTATDAITIVQDTCHTGTGCTPVGTIDFTVTLPVCNPVQFNGTTTGGVTSTSWNFGDPASLGNNTSALTNPTHQFTHAGWFTVTYSGTDPNSCAVSASHAVAIPLAADFSYATHCDSVRFTDNSTFLPPNSITSWSWSFPGGSPSTSTAQNPGPIYYSTPGAHSVTLTVSNGTCIVTITKPANAGVLPSGNFTLAPTGCAATDIAMNATGTGVVYWSWNFGDSATSALQNTSHAYTTAGLYTIVLTVSDSFGCSSSTSQQITITPPLTICSLTPMGPTVFCLGDSVLLKASPTGGYTYQWYNNNILIPSVNGNSYEALLSGNYTVTVTDPSGCKCTAGPQSVVVNPPPPATITSNIPPIICGSGPITLCAPSGPYTYLWSDINSTTTQCLSLYLATPGPQPFTVTVTDPATGCKTTSVAFIVLVYPTPPTPSISASGPTTLCKGDSVTLTSSIPSGNMWSTGATTQSITVNQAGTYTVTVTFPSGCTASANITVHSQVPDFSLFPFGCDVLCDSVKLPGPIGVYPGYYTYQWLYNGNPIAPPNGINDTLTPVGSGQYSLILTGPAPASCKDTSNAYNLSLKNCDSAQCHGKICGRKWNDANGNHKFNYGTEFGIPNWKICLVKCNVDNYPTKDTIACTTTDSSGFYCFNNLCAGDYCVVEENRPGWQQTWPVTPPFYHVTITDSGTVMGLDFGNKKKCVVIWVTLDTIGVPYNPTFSSGVVLPADVPWPVKVSYSNNGVDNWQPVFEGIIYPDISVIPCLPGWYSIKREVVANYNFDRIYVNDSLRSDNGDSIIVHLQDTTHGQTVVFLNVFAPDTTLKFRTFTVNQLDSANQAILVKKPGRHKPVIMPNTANVIDEIFKQKGSLLVGLPAQLNTVGKEKGYLMPGNQADVFKTFYTKGTVHTQKPRGLDFIAGKPILKRQKYLLPTKYNNLLLANLLALQVNIAASATIPPKTPAGFGDLVYENGENDPLSGMTINQIAAYSDEVMTNWEYRDSSVFINLNTTVQMINAAFAKPLPFDMNDTISWMVGKFQLRGTRALVNVPFLKKVAGVTPVIKPVIPPADLLPEQFKLYQNYPNPFNPTTMITFTLPQQAIVTVSVYNVLGQEVATLIDRQMMDDGAQEVEFNASKLSSGVYFYKLSAQTLPDQDGQVGRTFVDVKKMLLLR